MLKKALQPLMACFKGSASQMTTEKNAQIKKSPVKIGHRGAAGYCPENTFASFHKAIELGVDYLEIDVQMTKDGELVVIHDPTVNRTTNGKGKVKDFTLEQIRSLDAGSWFSPQFAGEMIPTLIDFLDEFSSKAGILIELKNPSLYPHIEEKLANELKRQGIHSVHPHNLIVQSFDRLSLKRFHSVMPSVPLGILVKNKPMGISRKELSAFSDYASYINPKMAMVNKRLIKKLHLYGFKTFIWTVRNKNEAAFLKKHSPDGIISDFPDLI